MAGAAARTLEARWEACSRPSWRLSVVTAAATTAAAAAAAAGVLAGLWGSSSMRWGAGRRACGLVGSSGWASPGSSTAPRGPCSARRRRARRSARWRPWRSSERVTSSCSTPTTPLRRRRLRASRRQCRAQTPMSPPPPFLPRATRRPQALRGVVGSSACRCRRYHRWRPSARSSGGPRQGSWRGLRRAPRFTPTRLARITTHLHGYNLLIQSTLAHF